MTIKKLFIILLFFIVILVVFNTLVSQVPNLSHPTNAKQKVIGWIPFWDQENAFESFSSNVNKFSYVSVFWYGLDSKGAIQPYDASEIDKNIIDFAHKNDVKVLAIVANLTADENESWDYNRVNRVISTPDGRRAHIEKLIELVEKNNLDGIDIDYEALKREQREDFSIFIDDLADALHAKGKILGVAIHPKTGEYIPEEDNGSHAQDLVRIAKAADQLYFMTYLENGKFSKPGPPGSIGWMEKVMRYALDDLKIPAQKAYLGVGLMGVRWQKQPDGSYKGEMDDIVYKETHAIAQRKTIEPTWDDASRTPHFTYEENNGTYSLWFENKDSIEQRIALAKQLGTGGVALWRLGGEDTQIWGLFD